MKGVQRSDDVRGNCLIVCPPTNSSFEEREKKQHVKTSVDKTSFEKLNPCRMSQ